MIHRRAFALGRDITQAGRDRIAEFTIGFLFGIIGPVFVAGVAWGYWSVPATGPAGRAAAAAVSDPGAATATPLGSGAVRVTWSAPASQLPSASYVVVRAAGPGAPATVCTVPVGTTACTDTTLVPGSSYAYTVVATVSSWRSRASAALAATPVPTLQVVPAAGAHAAGSPVGVTVRALLDGQVDTTYSGSRTLTWSGLATAPNGRQPVYPSSSASFVDGVAAPGSATSFKRGALQLSVVDASAPSATGSAPLDLAPGDLTEIVLSAQPDTVAAASSAAAGPFTVMLHDSYGNDVPVASATPVSLTASSATARFAAASGGAPVATITVPAGQSTASFWFGDTASGMARLTASASGVSTALDPFVVSPAAADHVAITSGALSGTVTSAAALGPATAVVQDQFGNAVPAPAGGRVLSLSSTSAGAVFAATSGGPAATSLVQPAGASSSSFYYGDTAAGTPTVTVSSPGLSSAIQVQSVSAAAASRLAFVSPALAGPSSLTASLGAITVARQDLYGNAVSTGTSAVALSSSSAGAVFSASSGGAAVTSVAIGAGSSSASFWYGDSRAGTPTLTAVATGLASATQVQSIGASKLVITSSAVSGTASATPNLGPVTVQQQDASGAAVNAASGGVAVALSSASTGAETFATTSGGSSVTSVTIPAGSSSASFWYGDTKAATVALTTSASGLVAATQNATIGAGSASRLTFTSSALTGAAASTAALGPVTVAQTDAFANPVTVSNGGGLAISLASNSSGTAVFAATSGGSSITGVTIPKNSSSASFYYGDTRSGAPTITASASGLTSGTQAQTVTGASPTKLVVTSSAVSGTASSTAALGPITVGLQDQFANATTAGAGGITVTPTSSSTGTVVYAASSGGPSTTTVTIPAGSSNASVWFGDTKAGIPTLSFAASGLTGASQAQTVAAAAPARLVITSSALSGTASSSAALGPITVGLRDAFGNTAVATSGGVSVGLASSSTGTKLFAAASGGTSVSSITVAAGSSTASAWYGDTKAGSPTITVSATGLTGATQSATITAASASKLVITSTALSGSASSSALLGPVTVQQQDAFSNPVTAGSAAALTLASSSTGDVFAATSGGSSTTTVSIAAGSSTASFWYGDTRTGTPTITVSRSGLTSATQSATITSSPTRLVLSGTVSGAASGSATLGPITATLQDDLGNTMTAGSSLTVALSSSSANDVFAASSGGSAITSVTIEAGSSSATAYYGDTKAGSPTITASATGLTSGTLSATITAGSASALTLSAGGSSLTASWSATFGPVTVTQVDAYGNAVSTGGGTLTVSLSSSTTGTGVFAVTSGGSSVTSVTIGTGRSSAAFYYGDTRVGTPTLTASATGRTSATLGLTVDAAAPSKLVFTSTATSGKGGSSATIGPISIGLRDAFGNVATAGSSTTVSLTSTGSGIFSLTSRGSLVTSLTIASGSSSASYYYSNTSSAGSYTMTVSSTGLTSASQGITIT